MNSYFSILLLSSRFGEGDPYAVPSFFFMLIISIFINIILLQSWNSNLLSIQDFKACRLRRKTFPTASNSITNWVLLAIGSKEPAPKQTMWRMWWENIDKKTWGWKIRHTVWVMEDSLWNCIISKCIPSWKEDCKLSTQTKRRWRKKWTKCAGRSWKD